MKNNDMKISHILSIICMLVLAFALSSCALPGFSTAKQVESLFLAAEALDRDGSYNTAIERYKAALKEFGKPGVAPGLLPHIDKNFPAFVNYRIAVCYSKLAEQLENSTEFYNKAIEYAEKAALLPTHGKSKADAETKSKSYHLWGELLYTTGEFRPAIKRFSELIEHFPDSSYAEEALYRLGVFYYEQRDYELSHRAFKRIIENFSDSNFVDDAWYVIGYMNYELQSYTECQLAFRRVLAGFPNSDLRDGAQYFIAKSLLEELNYGLAYLAYVNFLKHYPKSFYRVYAYFDLGTIYAQREDYDNARSNYALAMQHTDDQAWLPKTPLARHPALAMQHTDDQALLAEIQMDIGRAYYKQGDYKKAIAAYTSLLEKYPERDFSIEAKLDIANSHFRMRAWREAAGAYERVINEHPKATNFIPYCAYQIGEAYYELATNQNKQGQTILAVENFHNALEGYQQILEDFPAEISDSLDEIAELLITSLTRMRNDPGVSKELQSLAQLKMGDSYLAIKQYRKALAEYNTFVQAFPDSARGSSVQDRIKQVQEYIISKNLQQEKIIATAQIPIAQQIARKALASTVFISTKDAPGDPMVIGSGFFIREDQIVSNWHVVDGATTAYAVSVDEKAMYNIEGITAMNPKQDLVILKVSGKGKPLPLGNSNIVHIGESIYVTGNPEGSAGTFSDGVISNIHNGYAGKRLQITASISPGSSGGPVLNDKGEVIGIVYARHGGPDAQNLNLAIPVNYLKALLKRVGPPIPLSAR